jgi:hypothetical protein
MAISIDLTDPDDIRAKLPEIRRLYDEKRLELDTLTGQIELLGRLLGEKPIGKPGSSVSRSRKSRSPSRAGQNAPGQERAVRALEAAKLPAGPTSLYRFMVEKGLDAPKDANALGSNLWSAWKAHKIMKAPNGVYSLLDGSGRFEHDQPITDYLLAAQQGMPVPEHLPGPEANGSSTAALQTSPHAQTLSDGGGRPRESEEETVAPS